MWFKRYIKKCTVSYANTHHVNHGVNHGRTHLVSHTNTHQVNHGMVKLHKLEYLEQNITFLQNEKILNLCLRWHILRSYCFVVELTFNIWDSSYDFFCPQERNIDATVTKSKCCILTLFYIKMQLEKLLVVSIAQFMLLMNYKILHMGLYFQKKLKICDCTIFAMLQAVTFFWHVHIFAISDERREG